MEDSDLIGHLHVSMLLVVCVECSGSVCGPCL